LFLKSSINVDLDKHRPRGLRGRNVVNIHNQLTALLGWDKLTYCYALKMITVVIETFARCQLYRLLWP